MHPSRYVLQKNREEGRQCVYDCVCIMLTTRQAKFVRWVHWQPTTLVDSLKVVSVQPSTFQSPLPSISQCNTL